MYSPNIYLIYNSTVYAPMDDGRPCLATVGFIFYFQGTGIVPFISIIREILENGDDETVIR